ncbi:MAG: exopolysaccharide Pel transporter PelG [Actinobacteria bacterium]|nr:exopolysaccharide Pel transporter PelG [Actinomycetota bacterium]
MAGIGFELKKLFKETGFFSRIRAFTYSALVSLGPFVLCTIIIASILLFMNYMNISYKERELFIATIVYCFIFSQIIASGFKMVITRYIADTLYKEKFDMILPSLYGVLTVVIIFAGAAGILFFWSSPLPMILKLVSYLLFMELIIVFIMMEYLSTVKDYMKIVKSFLAGILSIVALSFVFLKYTSLDAVFGMLIAMDMGFMVIISFLMGYLKNFYGKSSKRYFDFLAYFDKYLSLFFVSFFYTLGLYSHNFLFWTSDLGVKIGGTYVYAPVYDVPAFYAFLSIMPSMIMFVVSVETSFYDKYRVYYSLITGKGNFKDIENARKDMTRVLWSEIRNIMELQLFFTLVFIAAGYYVLPRLGLTQLSIDIFNLLALGAFMSILMMIILLILLYFEDRSGALFVSISFLSSNVILTYLTMNYSESTYGMGFFGSALFSLIIALTELLVYLKNINYHTFCGQPIIYKEKAGFFGKLLIFFTPKKDRG